ncbi:TlpA family protein disulfide reductase [Microbacterium hominis]|uniref:TlpA family protein disulfide reductase n=1 Tax=Microbacterium TaxID=33882 RepID=UPI00168BA900|nr:MULTISPECIES: TlpA disulfide reductase family protein [Microbacterium]QOC24511.1 TlpA family protein disulfide reductase [Microbacterium hominis]QOC28583.1 TlpA family protein disulfide reductase [Microbacterium hominis]QYF99190.1 TlpA family protein disulfide reductase [Microbacterium sp. PAMC21962]
MRRSTTAKLAASLVALALAVGLAGCSGANDDLANQYKQGDGKGYISGDGSVQEIAPEDRTAAVAFTGTAVDGSTVTSADYAGRVLVLNFWYAGCGPCRAEAPTLENTFQSVEPAGAAFLGVNIYDGPEAATAFEQTYGISYPSLLAKDDADLKLAFASWTPLQSVPITLVLDKQGRVAARFVGRVESESILKTIVNDALSETS